RGALRSLGDDRGLLGRRVVVVVRSPGSPTPPVEGEVEQFRLIDVMRRGSKVAGNRTREPRPSEGPRLPYVVRSVVQHDAVCRGNRWSAEGLDTAVDDLDAIDLADLRVPAGIRQPIGNRVREGPRALMAVRHGA